MLSVALDPVVQITQGFAGILGTAFARHSMDIILSEFSLLHEFSYVEHSLHYLRLQIRYR